MTSTNRLVFFVNPETGKHYRLNGLKPCGSSEQTKFSSSRKYKSQDLPPSVDLRKMMTPIENQGDVGSWLVRKIHRLLVFVSVFFPRIILSVLATLWQVKDFMQCTFI